MRDQPAGLYRVAVTDADVGSRVSVRRTLRDGRSGLGDVVGELLAWGDVVVVRTRAGDEVTIARSDVVAAKVVPAAPPRRGAGRDEA